MLKSDMYFWDEQKIRETLPDARLYNFPPNWSGSGLVIWHDNITDDVIILVRRKGETNGILPKYIAEVLPKTSAILCTDATEYFKYNKPIIEVKGNNANAIIAFARYIRKYFTGKVCAITGSSGKTTTTRMIYDILSSKYNTSANLNKANTTCGISWNMSLFDINADYWIIETSLGGGMSRNSAIIKPDYAIIMNIAPVHLKDGMTTKDIADEKSKIFHAAKEGSTAVLFRESDHFEILKKAAEYKRLKIITFGESLDCDIRVQSDLENKFIIGSQEYILDTAQIAKHILFDMAAAIAVTKEENFRIEDILEVLKTFSVLEGRGQETTIKLSEHKTIRLIDESYNANPLSMKAALEGFGKLFRDKSKVLVLGDMAECGQNSVNYHLELAESIRNSSPKKLILCGKEIKYLYDTVKEQFDCIYFEKVSDLNRSIVNLLDDNDCVMVKSSNSSGLYKTVEVLQKAGI